MSIQKNVNRFYAVYQAGMKKTWKCEKYIFKQNQKEKKKLKHGRAQ